MITLSSFQTTTILPDPEQSDSEQLTGEVFIKRSVNGQTFTYVKTKNDRRRLIFRLRLTRSKSFELRAFIQSYFSSIVRLTDHEQQRWVGHLLSNPFEFEALLGEEQNIQLEFEGIKQ